ncbi:MAG: hypothetical protein IKX53_07710 [Bacteroidales bacterium]|nr:hypothetical protein [Bacteroidales bacterium]
MAFIYLGHPKTITDLRSLIGMKQVKDRSSVRIIVIDDQPFPYSENLRKHGFNIEQLRDLETLDSISSYEIVLCDVQGVGTTFHQELQGAYLVKEIRKRFPFKFIISYTAYDNDARYTALLKSADLSIVKDENTDIWVEKLDYAISSVSNIEEQWAKTCNHLLGLKVPLFQIALLENEVVTRIQKKQSFDNFLSINKSIQLESSAKDVILSFIGSAAVKFLLG